MANKERKRSREQKELDCPVCEAKSATVLVELDGKTSVEFKLQCNSCNNVFERSFKKPKQDAKSGKIIK